MSATPTCDFKNAIPLSVTYSVSGRDSGYWYMFTPSGFMVPGLRARTAEKLWDRYTKMMSKTRTELEQDGYGATRLLARVTTYLTK